MADSPMNDSNTPPNADLWVWCVEHPCEAAGEIERLRELARHFADQAGMSSEELQRRHGL